MSTGADCQFVQRTNGWYLRLQCWPYGENPDYDEYGPFKTQPEALAYLDNHFANPGGYTSRPLASHVCEQFDADGWCVCCGNYKREEKR